MKINNILLEGKLSHKYARTTDDGSTIYTKLFFSQRVGDGQGYNGSNYVNKFVSLAIPSNLKPLDIEDGTNIIISGSLKIKEFNNNEQVEIRVYNMSVKGDSKTFVESKKEFPKIENFDELLNYLEEENSSIQQDSSSNETLSESDAIKW